MIDFEVLNDLEPYQAKRGRKAKYPFSTMEVGQCASFPGLNTASNPAIAAYNYARKTGKKFQCATDDEGLKVWRIA